MRIKLAEYEIDADVMEKSDSISKYTGHKLEHISINIVVGGRKQNEDIIDYLGTANDKIINSIDNPVAKMWRIINSSHSYSDKSRVDYSLELEEFEDIKISKLVLDNLELAPLMYNEEFSTDDTLHARARVQLTEAQFKRLKELIISDSVMVIRQGINEEPRQMWLRVMGWSNYADCLKCDFVLNDKKEEKVYEYSLFNPWKINLMTSSSQQDVLIDRLSNLLIGKGVITRDEYEDIKAKIQDEVIDRRFDLYRVENLDEWEFL